MSDYKMCSNCKTEKPITEFYKRKDRTDSYRSQCKSCTNEKSRKYQLANPEQYAEYCRKYRKLNPKKCYENTQKWFKANPGKKAEYYRKWYEANTEKVAEYKREWNANNRERKNENGRRWKMANKDKVAISGQRYREANPGKAAENARKLYASDPQRIIQRKQAWINGDSPAAENYRIARNLRSRVSDVLKGKYKSAPTLVLLGCSIDDFKEYFAEMFTDGMTWNNHGEWHIDHIVPCAAFDLTDAEQQKVCFHYTNLQPLWANENLRKSAKLPHEWRDSA